MQKYWHIQRRRAWSDLVDWLVIIFFLSMWAVAKNPVLAERAIPYITAPGHILVQLAELPQLAKAETHLDPQWTLYGDGTLIYKLDPSDTLWRAQLAPDDIQQILHVIITQNAFFDTTQQRYGSITPDRDDDDLLLTVTTNSQQKGVVLASESTTQIASNLQATHVFAIKQFLLAYHPVHSVFYAPNPDPDCDSDDGPSC
jgi:hypothetical protein